MLLIPFVEEQLQRLPEPLQRCYVEFIDHEDWELFDWLQGREEPSDPQMRELIELILAAAARSGPPVA